MRNMLLVLLLASAGPAAAAVGGEIRAGGATVIVAGEPPSPGRTVEVPEGWYRVESAPEDEGEPTGSLTIVDRRDLARAAPARPAPPPPEPVPTREVDPFERTCGELREAYLKALLRMAGITQVDRPVAFLENLLGGTAGEPLSSWLRLNMFGLPYGGPWTASVAGVPLLQPLAWDFELQRLADELETCEEASESAP